MRARRALLLGLILVLGCALGDVYWTHASASKDDFVRALRKCRSDAKLFLADREHISCRTSTTGATYCKEESVLDTAVREERERLLREDIKNDCMEARGYRRSEDATAFREVRRTPRLPDADDS